MNLQRQHLLLLGAQAPMSPSTKALGITIPQSVLLRASEVIE